MKIINLLLISVMAASCVNLDGVLNVSQVLTAKKKGGFLNLQMKSIEIKPGSYRADLKVNSERSFTLKLRSDKEDESDILIPIKGEDSLNMPTNGVVSISGKDISQPFDIKGTMKTDVTYSDKISTHETCSYSRMEQRCEKVCVAAPAPGPGPRGPQGPGPGPRGDDRRDDRRDDKVRCDVVCRDVSVTYTGNRFVEYHNRYTSRSLSVQLLQPAEVATFTGNGTESDRINDYVGECR